jgi:hypothetical protein
MTLRHDGRLWVAFAAVTLLYVLIRVNLVDIPLDRDEGVFGYAGQVILDGGLPYRDVFDHKPPVVFYINAMALLLAPPTARGIHVFLHFYNFLTLITLYFLARVYFRSSSAGLWTAFCYALISASPALQGATASTEMFMLLPLSLSLLFAVLAARGRGMPFALLSGAVGAVAFWTRQTALFPAAFGALYLALGGRSSTDSDGGARTGRGIKALALWGAGALGVSLAIAGYFYLNGVFDEFVYWSFTHNILYGKMSVQVNKPHRLYVMTKGMLKGDFILVSAGMLFLLKNIVMGRRDNYFALGFFVFSLPSVVLGKIFVHYFAQLAPAVALAAGGGAAAFVGGPSRKAARSALAFTFVALAALAPILAHSWYYFKDSPGEISRKMYGLNPFPESAAVAEFIAGRTGPEDRVYILGSEPQILFYAGRKSPTPHIMAYPMLRNFPRHGEFQRNTLSDINRRPPEYILFVDVKKSLLWDGKADIGIFDQLELIVNNGYSLEAVMMVGGTGGYLKTPAERRDISEENIFGNSFNIQIYRRRGRV